MRYRVYTKRLYYEIELNGKYTVLNGDSGKGLQHVGIIAQNGLKSLEMKWILLFPWNILWILAIIVFYVKMQIQVKLQNIFLLL